MPPGDCWCTLQLMQNQLDKIKAPHYGSTVTVRVFVGCVFFCLFVCLFVCFFFPHLSPPSLLPHLLLSLCVCVCGPDSGVCCSRERCLQIISSPTLTISSWYLLYSSARLYHLLWFLYLCLISRVYVIPEFL